MKLVITIMIVNLTTGRQIGINLVLVLLNRIDSLYAMPLFTKNEIDLALDNFCGLNNTSNV